MSIGVEDGGPVDAGGEEDTVQVLAHLLSVRHLHGRAAAPRPLQVCLTAVARLHVHVYIHMPIICITLTRVHTCICVTSLHEHMYRRPVFFQCHQLSALQTVHNSGTSPSAYLYISVSLLHVSTVTFAACLRFSSHCLQHLTEVGIVP